MIFDAFRPSDDARCFPPDGEKNDADLSMDRDSFLIVASIELAAAVPIDSTTGPSLSVLDPTLGVADFSGGGGPSGP